MMSRVLKSTQNLAESFRDSLPLSPSKDSSSSSRQSTHAATPPASPTKSSHRDAHIPYAQSYLSHAVIPPPTPSLARTSHASSSTADVAMPTFRPYGAAPAPVREVHMQTMGRGSNAPEVEDVRMMTMRAAQEPGGLRAWERDLAESPEVRRKATVAQLYFLDYYFDLLGYIHSRSLRQEAFKQSTSERSLDRDSPEYRKELKSYLGRERVLLRKRRTKLKVDQFRIIAQVGQGGYGSVYLARKADTGEVCALKKMKKKTLAKMDEIKHVLVERDILTATKTPWLVKLLYAFQDPEFIYLAMEYVPGGDFRTLLNNSGVLKEEHAKFYIGEMFAAIDELHKLGYIHRDLKPENFLVDGTGHVKLTDFGLATGALNPTKIESMKHKLDKAKDDNLVFRNTLERRTMYRSVRMKEPRFADSVVGSPDYMPPEVLRGKQYSYSVDYWSLGCILFEFLAGFPPFSGATSDETWSNLKNWQKVLTRPVYTNPKDLIFNMSDAAWDSITRLIAHDKERASTIAELETLPFFGGMRFKRLRETQAPFVPSLEDEMDVGYYDDFSNEADLAKYGEVFEKQRNVDAVQEKDEGFNRGVWLGFTFGKNKSETQALAGRLKGQGDALETIF